MSCEICTQVSIDFRSKTNRRNLILRMFFQMTFFKVPLMYYIIFGVELIRCSLQWRIPSNLLSPLNIYCSNLEVLSESFAHHNWIKLFPAKAIFQQLLMSKRGEIIIKIKPMKYITESIRYTGTLCVFQMGLNLLHGKEIVRFETFCTRLFSGLIRTVPVEPRVESIGENKRTIESSIRCNNSHTGKFYIVHIKH